MHVAFISMGAVGHVLASLPFCKELVKRGHRVSFFSAEFIRPQAEPFGVDFYAVESPLNKGGKGDENAAENILAELPLRFLTEAAAGVESIVKVLENDRPDLILNDTMAVSGRLVAAYFNIPRIQFFTSFAANEHHNSCMFWPKELEETEPRKKARALALELQKKYGGKLLTTEEIFAGSGDFNIVTVDKKFQPAGETFDDRFFFAGPQIAERAGEKEWEPVNNGKKNIYVSLGTVFNNLPHFWPMLFEAVKDMDVNVICSIGNIVDEKQFGEIPENVYLYKFIPQLKVLQSTDAFVSHGGIGSIMEATWFGVPTFCIPQMDEQEVTASRVKELGLGGAILPPETVNKDALREGIKDLLNNEEYRKNIKEFQAYMHENEGPGPAADAALAYYESLK